MPSGRVFLSGSAADPWLEWVRDRLQDVGYEPALLPPPDGAPISLTPVVAGLDLWRAPGEERFEAIAEIDERLPAGRPLLTLCTAVSADEMASYVVRGGRVVGFSVFGPPRAGMLVELLPALGTEVKMAQHAAAFLETLGFTTEALPPGSWAVLPRVVAMIVNEAAVAISEGVAAASDIDTAMRLGANYPQGPLALADEIGLDEILTILEALHHEFGDDRYRPAPLLRRLVLAGYTGKATGRGFHLYP